MRVCLDAERPAPTGEGFIDQERFWKLSAHEPRCDCGHGLYSHYMCGGASRCLTGCGCGMFKPETKTRKWQPKPLDLGAGGL